MIEKSTCIENLNFNEQFFYFNEFNNARHILSSSMKTKLLLSLYNSEKKLAALRVDLKKPSATILHGINELEKNNLINKMGKYYCLSSTGHILTVNLMKLIEKWYSIELNIEFWINQDTSAIPQKYLKEIGIFRNPKFIFSEVSDFTKPLNEYLQLISQYNNLKVLLPVFSKVHFDAIIHKLNNNCNIELIINETIFKSIISHGYRKKLFDNLDNNEKRSNLKIWKVEEDLNIFLTVSEDFRFCESWDPSEDLEDSNCFTTSESLDNYEDLSTSENLSESKDFCNSNDLSESEDFMTLSLFFEDGSYNDSCILVDTSENAINWGLNLFNHYKKIAIPLKLFFNERYQSKYE